MGASVRRWRRLHDDLVRAWCYHAGARAAGRHLHGPHTTSVLAFWPGPAALCVLQFDVKSLQHHTYGLLPEDEHFVVLDDGFQLIPLRQA
jgi:hypothetical protein